MEQKEKIVDFTWCKKCKHEKTKEPNPPCDECLSNPVNTDSIRPIMWEEKK